MIGLLGATGYTGRLVADELDRRGIAHRRGARSADRLARLPHSDHAEPFIVDVNQPSRLDQFLDGLDAVINTVGPFSRYGMTVVDAAAGRGVTYVDSTGELGFMNDVYLRHVHAAAPIVPACGFDYLPGDLMAAVASADVGGAVKITVAYEMRGVLPSRGTARTAVLGAGTTRVPPKRRSVPFPDGTKTGVEIPWGELVTVPRHVPGVEVDSVLITGDLAALAMQIPVAPLAKAGASVLSKLAELLPEGPPEVARRQSRFRIVAHAVGGNGRQAGVVCEGSDVYGLTARFLVAAARQAGGAGALTPAQALEPEPFLDAVSGEDPTGSFKWQRFQRHS